ncbi:tyrosine-protein phosphatase [Caldicellulosiruptor morganii]|uniref:protein-tyrosine-phosphatase n=2 Tax=Caldicellulosiruptor morganii TaxID=1387555 RepID=A0ABY7BNM0_9FIRM|nr:CpsB/CapC family capsule biosynthesis tyrosine phosphatase [Caldicellulosiruptor morganii]WAM33641.1 protein tyrosine phosphatase [Caldicellulosiruptor morganii]
MVNVDDGPQTIDEAEKMLELAQEEGIKEIIVTPHYSARLKNLYESRFEEIKKIASNKGIILHKGCEYSIHDALLEKGKLTTLAGSEYVLIEIKHGFLGDYIFNQIYELRVAGYEVIVAHPERSFAIKDMEKLYKLSEMGIYFQITCGSILGIFGREVQKFAIQLMEKGLCHFLASDAHDSQKRRFYVSDAKRYLIGKYGSKEQVDVLLLQNQQAVIGDITTVKSVAFKKDNFIKMIFKKTLRR